MRSAGALWRGKWSAKIPFGGGLLGKAAVAYAGTKVLGLSLDRFYSIGYKHTREERDRLYAEAFRQGKEVAARILTHIRPDVAENMPLDRQENKPSTYPRSSQPRACVS